MKKKQTAPIVWLFGVVMALLPLVFDYLHRQFMSTPPPWITILVHGELLLVAIAILGDALARCAASDDPRKALRLALILGHFVVAGILIYLAAEIRARVLDVRTFSALSNLAQKVTSYSFYGFLAALILSLTTILVVED